jgi:predicted TIM-barrel fold metal-dependent hydrolase
MGHPTLADRIWSLRTEEREKLMSAIDADAHVIECETTFSFIDQDLQKHKPWVTVKKSEDVQIRDNEGGFQKEFWVIDGRLFPKEGNIGYNTTKGSREMADVGARLTHMDDLEIDVQVLYPTVFLRPVTGDPWVEYALCKSYNRWLAEIWKSAPDRLKWVVMPPLMMMDKMEEELRFAKDHGAVGVFLRGAECSMQADNPYFFKMYELGQELDLPMCFHSGNGSLPLYEIYKPGGLARGKLPVVAACSQLLMSEIPAMFPKLRWGFIEVSAQWVPYVINDYQLRIERLGKKMSPTILADSNIFVACQVTDDLKYVLDYTGEDQMVVGTDYGHADTSTEIEAMRRIQDEGKVPAHVVDKILVDNAKVLYGL